MGHFRQFPTIVNMICFENILNEIHITLLTYRMNWENFSCEYVKAFCPSCNWIPTESLKFIGNNFDNWSIFPCLKILINQSCSICCQIPSIAEVQNLQQLHLSYFYFSQTSKIKDQIGYSTRVIRW